MKLKFPNQDEGAMIEKIKKRLEELKLPSFELPKMPGDFEGIAKKIMEWSNPKRIAAMILVLMIVVISFVMLNSEKQPEEISQRGKLVQIKVKEGMDAAEISRRLEKAGIIESGFKFRILAKLKGYEDQLKIGSYNFTTGMTYDEVFTKLLAGAPEIVTVTIPEGFTVKDIANRLENLGIADYYTFTQKAKDFAPYDYIERRKNTFYDCEGFLFPDTYEVTTDMSVDDILYMMADNFDYRLSRKMREQAQEKGLSIYELITLASIVEKEARYAEDRPIIAQVFFKRLSIGMPLQTDASLQYLMDAPKEDVSIADTQIDSPYNTYQHSGLTPGPIANPGLDAIEAVLNPASTDYLYFVADRSGHNHYAYTYDEHLSLVNQYR